MKRKGLGNTLFVVVAGLSNIECTAPRHPSHGECLIFYAIDCNASNADVLVDAEYAVDQAGYYHLARVASVTPADSALRDKAIEKARAAVLYAPRFSGRTVAETIEFCERPPVTIQAFGPCPAPEDLAKRATDDGYRVKAVHKK